MATLSLFRHAKAEPADPGQDDFARKLTERGRKDAVRMGEILAGLGIDLALVSPAARTRETWELATQGWKKPPSVIFDDDLYLCPAGVLLERIRQAPGKARSIAMVGHNPSWQEMSLFLAGSAPAAATMRHKFPTASLAVFTVQGSWAGLTPGRTTLKQFATPG